MNPPTPGLHTSDTSGRRFVAQNTDFPCSLLILCSMKTVDLQDSSRPHERAGPFFTNIPSTLSTIMMRH